ncbi:MAG: amidophosphoribosyltransferase, partial [Chitinophagia bacterium]|nr:amidophosphoribosyltransferase [Chitinophagia bacterium]
RLRKPLRYYQEKHQSLLYGLHKLYLLMEKQRNRGQDGAGIACVKLGISENHQNMHRLRISGQQAIKQIMQQVGNEINELEKMYPNIAGNPDFMKGNMRFAGELLLGHLRYGTQGENNVEFCHPFVKTNTIPARCLAMAGNFNLVNTDELFSLLDSHPTGIMRQSDLGAMLETIHYYLCLADDTNPAELDVKGALKHATTHFDGGYTFCGLTGNGHSFVMRDPNGIRPCFYYYDDEIVVAASERAAIMTAFNLPMEQVQALPPGAALIVNTAGDVAVHQILLPGKLTQCSFERIYFSRGNDPDIYRERMQLGRNLAQPVLQALDYHLRHTIVSFIPNTAETAFYGLIKGLEDYLKEVTLRQIMENRDTLTPDEMRTLLNRRVRIEKLAIKDEKLRTFITEDAARNEMVQHIYDITYGTVQKGWDTLVVIDDSIVRGTTLRESIIKMLSRLEPKKIIIVSSAPQIRYPDCYGIDMSRMGDFIAFQAAVTLLQETGTEQLLHDTYQLCAQARANGSLSSQNYVKRVYEPFSDAQITRKIAQLITDESITIPVEVIFQQLEGLHQACPNNTGDWYFTGNYPTAGGNRVANRAFMNFMENKVNRGY